MLLFQGEPLLVRSGLPGEMPHPLQASTGSLPAGQTAVKWLIF